jgi:hypothetical protein
MAPGDDRLRIDRSAPVVATAEAFVGAAPGQVWEVLTGFGRWPSWNPDVTEMAADGPTVAGTTLRWRSGGLRITSVLREVDPPFRLGWTGRTLGIRAVHVWTLSPSDEGTRVASQESWRGPLPWLFRRALRGRLQQSLEAGLVFLRAEVAQRQSAALLEGPSTHAA